MLVRSGFVQLHGKLPGLADQLTATRRQTIVDMATRFELLLHETTHLQAQHKHVMDTLLDRARNQWVRNGQYMARTQYHTNCKPYNDSNDGCSPKCWKHHWKAVSAYGNTTAKAMRPPDWGNVQYTALLTCFALSSPNFRERLQWIIARVPSIHSGCISEYGFTMEGDVIDIFVAALRGHTLDDHAYTAVGVRFDATTLKQVCCWLEHACKLANSFNI